MDIAGLGGEWKGREANSVGSVDIAGLVGEWKGREANNAEW